MWTLVLKDIAANARRMWKLYLTNIIAMLVIILLYAMIAGSARQMDLLNTVFSGEVTMNARAVPQTILPGQFEKELLPAVAENELEFFLSVYEFKADRDLYVLKKGLDEDERYRLEEILKTTPYRTNSF